MSTDTHTREQEDHALAVRMGRQNAEALAILRRSFPSAETLVGAAAAAHFMISTLSHSLERAHAREAALAEQLKAAEYLAKRRSLWGRLRGLWRGQQ